MKIDATLNSLMSAASEKPSTEPQTSFGLFLTKQAEPPLTGDPAKDISLLAHYNLQRLNALAEAIELRLSDCDGPKDLSAMIRNLMDVRAKIARLATDAVDDVAGAIGKKAKRTVEAD